MGIVKTPPDVCLIAAICYNAEFDIEPVMEILESLYGAIEFKSDVFDFVHTNYYKQEMGESLRKFFCSFKNLIEPMQIVDIKLKTNEIEEQNKKSGNRMVNLDPGYMEPAKLILATTKNFSHRIYLGKGIYGDVQLFWRDNRFQDNPWTYPDYKEERTKEFFTRVRKNYLQKGVI